MWVHNIQELGIDSSNHYYAWLTQPTALSATIKSIGYKFSIRVISQQLSEADSSEQQALSISENDSLIREVYLQADGVPWIYGRVVIPKSSYLIHQQQIDSLGEKPLGETLFYGHDNFQRSEFSYKLLNTYPGSSTNLLFARRSIFELNGLKALVSEVFLPDLPTINSRDVITQNKCKY